MEPSIVRQMVISLRSDGSVAVEAPLDDKMFCYALLEMARDLIKDHKASLITPIKRVG